MEWVIGAVIVALPVAGIAGLVRARRSFDRMIEPADDLERADDGQRPGLAERDGTGGFI